ncbi:MAG TPA: hypothetical protein VKZ41_00375 [Gemmatimonadales bacterium]|nr:hypothetical protein [Gemmatimonadales bacterium]
MSAIRHRTRTLGRGIDWLPRHDSHYILARMMVSARHATPICIVQDTLREVEGVMGRASVFSFGLLTGSLCHCRRSERDYTLIDGWDECEYPSEEGDVYGLIARTLRERMVLAERAGATVIGFYLSGTSVVPRVAREDIALFRAVFEQPWNVMLLRDRAAEGEVGAFMRVESVDEQPYAAPFTELLPDAGRGNRGKVPTTVVRWTNYQPTESVRADGGGEVAQRVPANAGVPWHRELFGRAVGAARTSGGSTVSDLAAVIGRLRGGNHVSIRSSVRTALPSVAQASREAEGPAESIVAASVADTQPAAAPVADTRISDTPAVAAPAAATPVAAIPPAAPPQAAAQAVAAPEVAPPAAAPIVATPASAPPAAALPAALTPIVATPAVAAPIILMNAVSPPPEPGTTAKAGRLFELPPPSVADTVIQATEERSSGVSWPIPSASQSVTDSPRPAPTQAVAADCAETVTVQHSHPSHAHSQGATDTWEELSLQTPHRLNSPTGPFELLMVPPREAEFGGSHRVRMKVAAIAVFVVALGVLAVALMVRPG